MIRSSYLPVLSLILATISGTTNAAAQQDRWVRIDRLSDRTVYVDRLSARLVDSTIAEVWISIQFKDEQEIVDKKYNRMVGLVRLDCRAHQLMPIESNFYLDEQIQRRVPFRPESREWIGAPPESMNETLVIKGCLIAQGKPTEAVK